MQWVSKSYAKLRASVACTCPLEDAHICVFAAGTDRFAREVGAGMTMFLQDSCPLPCPAAQHTKVTCG